MADTLGQRLLQESQDRYTEEDLQKVYLSIEAAKPLLEQYKVAFAEAEEKYGLPKDLLYYVAAKESSGREDIISGRTTSPAGAVGLMQFMPRTARQYGLITDTGEDHRTDPAKAIDAAGRYFKDLQGYEGVSDDPEAISVILAMYNWGPGNVREYEAKKKPLPKETAVYIRALDDVMTPYEGMPREDTLGDYFNTPEEINEFIESLFPDGIPHESDSGILNTTPVPPVPVVPEIDQGGGGSQLMTPKPPVQMDIYQTALAKREQEKKEGKEFA